MILTIFRATVRKMSSNNESLLVPLGVRGLKQLDRVKFVRKIQVPIIKVTDQNLSNIIKYCKPHFLKLEKFKPIQHFEDEVFTKCVYLNPDNVKKWDDLGEDTRKCLQLNNCCEKNFTTKEVELNYENWSFDTIFKAVLPEGEEIVSSYSVIGHILHLNLREHLYEYRHLIGQVLLDKIKTCRTVVNKSNSIDNTFRNFSMEVLAGEEDFLVTVKENRCSFQFDFSKVYWNSRLGKEHERILSFLKPDDVLFDVFCGVGPFAVPAAKRKCKVFANDLNPDSYKWLNHNAVTNKVPKTSFQSFNMDGKDFICDVFKNYLLNIDESSEMLKDAKVHVTMNLPALAVEFIKYFKGLLKDCDNKWLDRGIVVYLYCFVCGDEPFGIAKQIVNEHMGCDMTSYITDVFDVRNVSPKKEMMRVTFKLTKEILFDIHTDVVEEPPSKKLCVEDNKTN